MSLHLGGLPSNQVSCRISLFILDKKTTWINCKDGELDKKQTEILQEVFSINVIYLYIYISITLTYTLSSN